MPFKKFVTKVERKMGKDMKSIVVLIFITKVSKHVLAIFLLTLPFFTEILLPELYLQQLIKFLWYPSDSHAV